MGKNTKGGSKHKKYARNRDESGRNDLKNLLKEPGQEYAFVEKTLGNCRFTLHCWDKKIRLGSVRGKMRKRVWINRGEMVLVGLREFQDDKCDIIQKYTPDQVNKLIKKKEFTDHFAKDGKTFGDGTNDTFVNFGQDIFDQGESDDDTPSSTSSSKTPVNNVNELNINDLDGEINFDDI